MKNNKVLITGCGGMLGEAAYNIISKNNHVVATDINLNEDWLTYLDVRDIESFESVIQSSGPFDIILHLAAHTDLEYCEINQKDAWLTNALGPENAAIISNKYNTDIVYISTAGIFDHPTQEVFCDFDPPSPKSIYGKSKHAGEITVQHLTSKHYIFRAGWMMGGGPSKDKKFINKLIQQIESGAEELNIVNDKLGTPTYTHDFIYNMLRVIDRKYYGLYNQVCKGSCSRLEVAEELIKILQLDIKINSVDSAYFQQEYFAPRPLSEKLTNMKLESRGLNKMRDWRVCLKEYIEQYYKNNIKA